MKNIVKIFAECFIVVFVMLSLFTILNNVKYRSSEGTTTTGMFNILGKRTEIKGTDFDTFTDSNVLREIVSAAKPYIFYSSTSLRPISENDSVQLLDYFTVRYNNDGINYKASSLDGNNLKVIEITAADHSSILTFYDPYTKMIRFPEAGVYTITFYIIDQEQRESISEINIPVGIKTA